MPQSPSVWQFQIALHPLLRLDCVTEGRIRAGVEQLRTAFDADRALQAPRCEMVKSEILHQYLSVNFVLNVKQNHALA